MDKKKMLDEMERLQLKMKSMGLRADQRFKKKGFTYKGIFWIHPYVGGDDYQRIIYSKGPFTKSERENALRKSSVKDDYNIIKL